MEKWQAPVDETLATSDRYRFRFGGNQYLLMLPKISAELRLAGLYSKGTWGALQGGNGAGGRVRGGRRCRGEGRPVQQELWIPLVLLFASLQQILKFLLVHPAVPRWLNKIRRLHAHDVPLPLPLARGGDGSFSFVANCGGAECGGGGGGGDVEQLRLPRPRDNGAAFLSVDCDRQASNGKGDGN